MANATAYDFAFEFSITSAVAIGLRMKNLWIIRGPGVVHGYDDIESDVGYFGSKKSQVHRRRGKPFMQALQVMVQCGFGNPGSHHIDLGNYMASLVLPVSKI